MIETIEETTMGNLGDVPTGMASMGMGSYTLPDGSEVKGMSCVLAPTDQENVIIGMGSVAEVQLPGGCALRCHGSTSDREGRRRLGIDLKIPMRAGNMRLQWRSQ